MSAFIKVAFLDRDGVINERQASHHYVTTIAAFKFNDGIFAALKHLVDNGFKLIVITNQQGLAKGLLTAADLAMIHERMVAELKKQGIPVLDIFFCPHREGECICRKPQPGLLKLATDKYDINLPESILVSDEEEDVKMGKDFGVGKNIRIDRDKPEQLLKYL